MWLEALTMLAIGLQLVPNSPREELKRLQGTWDIVSGERAGEKLSEDVKARTRLVISGRQYSLETGGETETGTLKFDQRKKPRQIELTCSNGKNKGKTALGIYMLEDDSLTTCFAEPGNPRPEAFTTKSGSGHALYVMKRVKP